MNQSEDEFIVSRSRSNRISPFLRLTGCRSGLADTRIRVTL